MAATLHSDVNRRVATAWSSDSPTFKVAVAGYGYWGPNLVRNFSEVPGVRVAAVSDLNPERLLQVQARYPAVAVTTSYRDLLEDPTVDAVILATPVSTHFDLALEALEAGKHVMVEKPLTQSSSQATALIEAAARQRRVLFVDHTFVYTGAVRKIKELVDAGHLGRLLYYDSVRVNLGIFQHDVDVLWDLAVHDLAIMDHVLGMSPLSVAASGVAHFPNQPVNTAYLTCFFEDDLIAHFHVNWLAPVKVRRTLIGGDRQMIVYDDLEPSEKVKVYDKGVTVSNGQGTSRQRTHELLVDYRAGDMCAPRLSLAEALGVEAHHFVECCRSGVTPLTDGHAGLRVVRILEAAAQSLARRGQPVDIA